MLMGCFTYLKDSDKNAPIQNKHVAEWLSKAREATGVEIVVLERRFDYTRWFRKRTDWRYEILWPSFPPEYQEINFYRDGSEWSINLIIPAELAVAYLIGVCAQREPTPSL